MSDFEQMDIPQPNYRRRRAEAITASIMRALERHIPDSAKNRAWDDVCRLFIDADAEIITETDRLAAGLPARDANGLTPEAHRIIEAQRALLLTKPPNIYICAKCAGLAENGQ